MEQQLLDQLVDVYQPDTISWWPLAPGWWFLLFLSVALSFLLTFWLVKRYRRNYWKKEAISRLKFIQTKYNQEHCETEYIALMQLVKTVLYTKTRDPRYLSLVGDELIKLATTINTSSSIEKELKLLTINIYQANSSELTQDNFDNIRAWIKGL